MAQSLRLTLGRAGRSDLWQRLKAKALVAKTDALARSLVWRLDHRGAGPYSKMTPEQALRTAFDAILHREPDDAAKKQYLPWLRGGGIEPRGLVEWLVNSGEWLHGVEMTQLGPSLHFSRSQFVQSLPAAKRILDLGGTSLGSDEGAFVSLGYPYNFEELIIVDLPHEERDAIYQESVTRDEVMSPRGPVRYRYHSMADLSNYESASFDLIYSGQSIEHIPVVDAKKVLAEAFRVLRPGGILALDTPNARVTRLQQAEFIDPDHEYEYTHAEIAEMITTAGFAIAEAKGCNYAGDCLREGHFSLPKVATRRGLYAAIEDCYLLAYVCRKP